MEKKQYGGTVLNVNTPSTTADNGKKGSEFPRHQPQAGDEISLVDEINRFHGHSDRLRQALAATQPTPTSYWLHTHQH